LDNKRSQYMYTRIHCIPQRVGSGNWKLTFSSPQLIFIVISGSAKTRPKLRWLPLPPQGMLFCFRLCLFQLLHYAHVTTLPTPD
jgi:hypothetical protein